MSIAYILFCKEIGRMGRVERLSKKLMLNLAVMEGRFCTINNGGKSDQTNVPLDTMTLEEESAICREWLRLAVSGRGETACWEEGCNPIINTCSQGEQLETCN